MAGITAIDICSRALTRLGDQAISSFEESDNAIVCGQNYETIKLNILSRHPWRITMAKKKLQQDATDPINEWSYSHQVPNDGLEASGSIRAIFTSNNNRNRLRPLVDYEVFGKFVYSHHIELWADYQKDVIEQDLPPYLVELLIFAVAAEVAEAVTDQTSKVQVWTIKAYGSPSEGMRGGQYRIAAVLDSQQQPPQLIEDFELTDVRFS